MFDLIPATTDTDTGQQVVTLDPLFTPTEFERQGLFANSGEGVRDVLRAGWCRIGSDVRVQR